MFSWLRRKNTSKPPSDSSLTRASSEPQAQVAAKPFEAVGGRVTFDNGQRSWEESFDCIASLLASLRRHGRSVRTEDNRVVDEATGLCLRPVLVEFQPIHNKGVRTCTKIDVTHPKAIPRAIYDFQHSTGETMTGSISAGFDSWSKTDLLAIADATREHPLDCTIASFEFPATGERPVVKRRVILGPTTHFQECPPKEEEEHPFCPCCLFTQSMKAFEAMLNAEGLFAVRLFAMRSNDGSAEADCRVNGEDFDTGKKALVQYTSSWPQAGMEFRKQYVIIQDAPLLEPAARSLS